MVWALVATVSQPLTVYIPASGDPMTGSPAHFETITAVIGTIINLIVYDGVSPYTPPDGTKLEEVPDTAQIGDTGY